MSTLDLAFPLAAAFLAATLTVSAARAAEPAPAPGSAPAPSFEEIDLDHDGTLSLAEAERAARRWLADPQAVYGIFGRADENEDNRIERPEFGAFEAGFAASRHRPDAPAPDTGPSGDRADSSEATRF